MTATWTYRCEYVKCGKAGCRSCPHGPYWYGYCKIKGKMAKRYFGKERPPDGETKSARVEARYDAIFNNRTATVDLAMQILGLFPGFTKADLLSRYRKLAMECHPDRGGDPDRMRHVSAAYSFLKAQRLMW